MTPEEFKRAVIRVASSKKANTYVTFRTASHAKIVIDAMCRYAKRQMFIISGTLEEKLYKDALDAISPGVVIRVIITSYGPHWDVPEDIEVRFIDEPESNDVMIQDEKNFKHENKSSAGITDDLDDFVVEGAAGFGKDEWAVDQMSSRFDTLWEKATPVIR